MKADLHNHGAIGFQTAWQLSQGYYGRNLTKALVDNAIKKDIGLCAITSEEIEIPKGHYIHDRFFRLCKDAEMLPENYSCDKMGDVALIVDKKNNEADTRRVIIVNGQTVIVRENGARYDHLVVGSNQIPNSLSMDSTMALCRDAGLVQILEHPNCEKHFGLGRLAEKYASAADAVEGHNSQMILPRCLAHLPILGAYNHSVNDQAKDFAKKFGKPYIATSDAHRFGDTGVSYIEFPDALLDLSSGPALLGSLKKVVHSGEFQVHESYPSLVSWFAWTIPFGIGLSFLKIGKKN